MKRYRLSVEIEALDDGRYLAIAESLRGCHAEGDTIAEAIEYVEDVARVIIELCLKEGLPLPPELEADDESPIVKAEVVVQVAT